MAVFITLLLALTMVPAAGVQTAFADEQFAVDGLVYKTVDGGAVLVGFEDGGSLGDNITVPEKVGNGSGELTVTGVDVAEGQAAPGVKALGLPQTVEGVNTKSLAAAMPGLAAINVDGTAGAYSSANGLLFRQADEAASSDGFTVKVANRELLWTPPATVIARIPGTCKRVAAGAFTDAKALETIMAFSTVESIARPEKDAEGNVVKEGAFNDEQVSRVNIVIPISATVQPEGSDRISADVFLSEQVGLDVKQTPWCDYGFDIKRFTVGIPCGSTSVTVAVPEDGKVETPVITVGDYVGYPQWNPKPGEVDWPADGLVFEYKADMTVSVRWDGDKGAIPSRLELPAYVVENGVKTAVTEVAPNAFEGATQLESVVIPEGVTTIGESAFAGCSGLESASLSSTLRTIDYAAFKGTGLESVDIPSGVRTVGGEAFAGCALASFDYSDTTYVSENAVDDESLLHDFISDSEERTLVSDDEQADSSALSAYSSSIGRKGTLGSDATVDDIYLIAHEYYSTNSNSKMYPGVTYTNNSSINLNHVHSSKVAEDPLSLPAFGSGQYGPDSNSTANGIIAANGGSMDVANWTVVGSFVATCWSNTLCWIIQEPSGKYYKFRDIWYEEDKSWGDHAIDMVGKVTVDGITVPTFPEYVAITPTSRSERLDIAIDPTMVDVTFDHGLANTPADFESTVRCAPGANLTAINDLSGIAGLDFVGWGLVNADGTKTYEDQRNGDGKLIAPSTDAHYFGMWKYGLQYYNKDGSARIEPTADVQPILGKDEVRLPSSNGIPDPEGYESLGWSTTANSGPAEGYGLGAALPASFDPTQVPLDKVDPSAAGNDHTYKLYAASVPKRFNVTYNPNGGTWGDTDGAGMDNKTADKVVEREFPQGAEMLSDLTREGFWFVGWSMNGNTETVDADRTKEEYTDFTLTAVWQPRVYRVEYDVKAAANNVAEGESDITAPNNSSFVHPKAIDSIYDKADDGTLTLKSNLNSQGIVLGQVNNETYWYAYGLPVPNNKDNALGYVFAGWSTDDLEIGVKPEHGPWMNFSTDTDMIDTLFPSQTNTVPEGSQSYSWGNNWAKAYSTWLSYETVPVTLGVEGPVGPATKADGTGDGETVTSAKADGTALDAALAAQTIYYWPEKGLVKGTYNNKQNTGEVVAASGDDFAGKGKMDLSVMHRYGYRFIGWGVRGSGYADDPDRSKCTVYAYYDEKGKTIKLTDAGAAKIADEWNAKTWEGSYDPVTKTWTCTTEYAPTAWQALWEVRTYDVTLRLPASAVNGVKLNNGDYTWAEDRTASGEVGANPSWYVGKKTWKYWDTLAVPEPLYGLNTGFNTYEGWFNDKEKTYDATAEGATAATLEGRKIATEADVYKGSVFRIMKKTDADADKNPVTKDGGAWGNLLVDETRETATRDQFGFSSYTGEGDARKGVRVADGEVVLWLHYTPVYINATAPMGVWLANDEETGGAYVVGSDKRMHLESKASFTVKTDTTHDLVLTDVKATDIVSATTTQSGTGAEDSVTDVVLDEGKATGSNGKGFCETLFDVYTDADDASKVYYDTDSSRMFWISPSSTVTYNAALGEANATADANAKRRYFGFGHVDGDNVLHGDASVSGTANVLDAFRLKHGASMSAGGMGGLVVGSEVKGSGDDADKVMFKNYDFYYGLDLRRCKIKPSAAQALLEATNKAAAATGDASGEGAASGSGAWEYNEPHKQPLVRVMFTFAVERNALVSYSARMGETFDAAAVAASAAGVDAGSEAAPEVSVGPAAA